MWAALLTALPACAKLRLRLRCGCAASKVASAIRNAFPEIFDTLTLAMTY